MKKNANFSCCIFNMLRVMYLVMHCCSLFTEDAPSLSKGSGSRYTTTERAQVGWGLWVFMFQALLPDG